MSRKKAERKSKGKNSGQALGIRGRIGSETTDSLLGLLLLFVALYAIVAMISYFSTSSIDQSVLENMRPGEWVNSNHEFANTCGSFGALLSYYLMAVNFGWAAFLIPVFVILVGLKLIRPFPVNLLKWFFALAVVMIWCSVAFAKFLTPLVGGMAFNPGGNHGLYVVQHLENLVGAPGLTIILLVTALAFLTLLTSQTITVIRKVLNPKTWKDKIPITIVNRTGNTDDNDEVTALGPDYSSDDTANGGPRTSDGELVKGNSTVFEYGGTEQEGGGGSSDDSSAQGNDPELSVAQGEGDGEKGESDNPDETVTPNHVIMKADGQEPADGPDLSKPINPWEPYTNYKFPTFSLLKAYDTKAVIDMDEIKANNARIMEVLNSFGVKISRINATVGPTVTLYEITPAEGVRISRIRGLEDDIALSLAALGIRIIAPMPGKGTIGIEVPNKKPQIVSMESVLNTKKFQNCKMALPMALGKTITNDVFMVDLAKLPHLLVAGATGQGKSVGLNAIITSLLYKKHPNELKFVLVDPKKVEFSIYQKIAPHFMAALPENEDEPIITDVQRVVRTLKSLCKLMDTRYDLLKKAHVKKIDEYNEKYVNHRLNPADGHAYMPYIVVIIDEFGDLIMTAGKEIETPIARIAQLARAVGIHMIIATQRPTTKIITGNIKANFPGRMAFRVSSQIDSRTILDRTGANQLVGRGDMLFLSGSEPVRVQCAFIDTPEIEAVNDYISQQPGPKDTMELPEPDDPSEVGMGEGGGMGDAQSLDPYFDEAARAIVVTQQGSTSMIQRRFSIGYNRAGRLMDQLEKAGIVGQAQGSKPREVLLQDENSLNVLLERLHGGAA